MAVRSAESGDFLALAIAKPLAVGQSLFRPLLSDDHKVGFFSSDRQVQTVESEIVDLKELTNVVEQLLEDSATMRKDIRFARGVMQAEFDSKLKKKALELYKRINERTTDIEKMHLERVGTIRRAFKQQLADALGSVQNVFNKNTEVEKKKAEKTKQKEAQKWEGKMKDLQAVIQHNESIIGMLKMQIAQLQERNDMRERKPSVASSTHSEEIAAAREEIEDLSNQVSKLEKNLEKVYKDIDERDDQIDRLEKKLEKTNKKLESEAKMAEQLQEEKGALLQSANLVKDTSQELLEEQKIQLEKEFQEKFKVLQEQSSSETNSKIESIQRESSEAIQNLKEEKRIVEELLAKEKAAKKSAKSVDKQQLERVRLNEQRSMQNIARLKDEIERVNRTWEKKFEVLQRSMYALKDESYLRQTLLKQSAQLHQASISYSGDPTRLSSLRPPPVQPIKKDLHVQGKGNKPSDHVADDAISYTVSVPSGRATTTFSVDENEVLSDVDDPEMDEQFKALPVPSNISPTRTNSARSQVNVVMPKT